MSSDEEVLSSSEMDVEHEESVGMNDMGGDMTQRIKRQKMEEEKDLDFSEPTTEELSNLNATQQLFKSNLLKLQIKEVLGAVEVDYEKLGKLEDCLHKLKSVLDEMPSQTIQVQKGTQTLGVHLHRQTDLEMPFIKPERVDLIGNYLLKTLIKPDLSVDVCITMSMKCFQLKDHINHRYFDKRAAYLNAVAMYLNNHKLFKDSISVSTFRGDPLKPILVLRRPTTAKKSIIPKAFSIRIFVGIPEDFVPARKLGPMRNAVRSCVIGSDMIPTPYYNQSVLEDMHLVNHLKLLHAVIPVCQAYEDTVRLLKIWGKQRELHCFSFNGFLFSMVLLYLHRQRKINMQMSCYQIFRAVMQCLAEEKLCLSMYGQDSEGQDEVPALEEFQRAFPVVLIDPSGFLNLTYRITESAWKVLNVEVKETLKSLDDPAQEKAFNAIFLQKVQFHVKYDNYFDIDLGKKLPKKRNINSYLHLAKNIQKPPPASSIVLPCRDAFVCLCEYAVGLLKEAFTDRVTHIAVEYTDKDEEWIYGTANQNQNFPHSFRIGVNLSPFHFRRDVDRGPPADHKADAETYRDFWGDLSELRRFQDGAIVEAVVWEVPDHERHLIMSLIAKHIVSRHFGVSASNIRFIGSQLDFALQFNKYMIAEKQITTPHPSASSRQIKDAFKELTSRVRDLPGLPLTMLSIQGVHPVFSDCALFPPQQRDLASLQVDDLTTTSTPITVLIQFERSSSWPDDLNAMKRVKTAFYLRIGSLIKSHHNLPCKVAHEWVDVFLRGFVFRVQIYNEREIYLQKVAAEEKAVALLGTKAVIDNKLHVPKLPSLPCEIDLEIRPQHVNFMRGLNLQFPQFGESCQMAKRWISAHLFSTAVCEEAVELLVASCFLDPLPFLPPCSAIQGFHRFLRLLASHDWYEEPLIVDINGKMTPDLKKEILSEFESARKKKEGALLYIASPQDPYCLSWTRKLPTAVQFSQIVLYAQGAVSQFETILSSSDTTHKSSAWKALFRTPLQQFDLFITLRDEVLPGRERALHLMRKKDETSGSEKKQVNVVSSKKANKQKKKFKAPPSKKDMENGPSKADLEKIAALVVGFDPAQLFLRDLKRQLHRHAFFYFDAFGSNIIAVSFKKEAFLPTHLTVSNAPYKMPQFDKKGNAAAVVPNMKEIIADIHTIGKGLVKDVYQSFEEYASAYGASH